jgi:hypothetical protein
MGEQQRKRVPGKMPGEGTGVYGVDPLVFLKPGDDPDVDHLLEELREDCDDGDPFWVDYRKRKGNLKAPANSQGGAAEGDMEREPGDESGSDDKEQAVAIPAARNEEEEKRAGAGGAKAARGGLNARWLQYAAIAIVGPVVALALLVLASRNPSAAEGPRETVTRREISLSPEASVGARPPPAGSAFARVAPGAGDPPAAPSVAPAPSEPGTRSSPAGSGQGRRPAGEKAAPARTIAGHGEQSDPFSSAPPVRPATTAELTPQGAAGKSAAPEKPEPPAAPKVDKNEAEF